MQGRGGFSLRASFTARHQHGVVNCPCGMKLTIAVMCEQQLRGLAQHHVYVCLYLPSRTVVIHSLGLGDCGWQAVASHSGNHCFFYHIFGRQ